MGSQDKVKTLVEEIKLVVSPNTGPAGRQPLMSTRKVEMDGSVADMIRQLGVILKP